MSTGLVSGAGPLLVLAIAASTAFASGSCGDSAAFVVRAKQIYAALSGLDVDLAKVAEHRAQFALDYTGEPCIGGVDASCVFANPREFMLARLKWCDWWLREYEKSKSEESRSRALIACTEKPIRSAKEELEDQYAVKFAAAADSAESAALRARYDRDTFALLEAGECAIDHHYAYRTLHAFKQVFLVYLHQTLLAQLATLDPSRVDRPALTEQDSSLIYFDQVDWLADLDAALRFARNFPALPDGDKYTILAGSIDLASRDPGLRAIVGRDSLLSFLSRATFTDLRVIDPPKRKDDVARAERAIEAFTATLDRFEDLDKVDKDILARPRANLFCRAVGHATTYRYPDRDFYLRVVLATNQYFDYVLRNGATMDHLKVVAFRKVVKRFHKRNRDRLNLIDPRFRRDLDGFVKNVE